eukprot:6201099-Pleurochrysis_carterae.AAC.1
MRALSAWPACDRWRIPLTYLWRVGKGAGAALKMCYGPLLRLAVRVRVRVRVTRVALPRTPM